MSGTFLDLGRHPALSISKLYWRDDGGTRVINNLRKVELSWVQIFAVVAVQQCPTRKRMHVLANKSAELEQYVQMILVAPESLNVSGNDDIFCLQSSVFICRRMRVIALSWNDASYTPVSVFMTLM